MLTADMTYLIALKAASKTSMELVHVMTRQHHETHHQVSTMRLIFRPQRTSIVRACMSDMMYISIHTIYTCMYVYVYIRLYIRIYIYVLYICTYVRLYIRIYIYVPLSPGFRQSCQRNTASTYRHTYHSHRIWPTRPRTPYHHTLAPSNHDRPLTIY